MAVRHDLNDFNRQDNSYLPGGSQHFANQWMQEDSDGVLGRSPSFQPIGQEAHDRIVENALRETARAYAEYLKTNMNTAYRAIFSGFEADRAQLENAHANLVEFSAEISGKFNERGDQIATLQDQNNKNLAALSSAMAKMVQQKNFFAKVYVVTAIALPIAIPIVASYAYNHFFPSIPDFSPKEQNSDSLVQNLNSCLEQKKGYDLAQQKYQRLHSLCETDLREASNAIDATEKERTECEKNLKQTYNLYESTEKDLLECAEALESL